MVYPHAYRTEHSETHTTSSEYGDYYARSISKKIHIQPALHKILQYVDSHRRQILADLAALARFRTVWPDAAHAGEMVAVMEHLGAWMRKLGAKYESFDIGAHKVGGRMVKLPPIMLATVAGASRVTVCVYGHVDVRAPCASRWLTDPWQVTEVGRELFGNGLVRGKGPLLSWLEALHAFNCAQVPLPVTVKFIIETCYFNRSFGLKDFLMTQKQSFLHDVTCVVLNDCQWLNDKYPCIAYGVVGIVHMELYVTAAAGGEEDPEAAMAALVAGICSGDAVTVPGFGRDVTQVTPDEENLYESISVNFEELKRQFPPERQAWSKSKTFMHYWRMPTIFVDKVERCTCERRDAARIKRHIILKVVPKQIPGQAAELVKAHILQLARTLQLRSAVDVEYYTDTKPWVEDCHSLNYEAARRATIQVYKEDPNFIRDDKDLKCLNILEMIERNILILPLSVKDGFGGEANEHVPQKNFFEGIKLLAAYLFQVRLLSDGGK